MIGHHEPGRSEANVSPRQAERHRHILPVASFKRVSRPSRTYRIVTHRLADDTHITLIWPLVGLHGLDRAATPNGGSVRVSLGPMSVT